MKCLYYGEFPGLATGAAQVSRMLMPMLGRLGYEIEAVSINRNVLEGWDTSSIPWKFHEGTEDSHSRALMKRCIADSEYDLLFMTGDINILDEFMDTVEERRSQQSFTCVVYVAVDSDIFLGGASEGLLHCLHRAEVPVVYSQWALDRVLSHAPELDGKLTWIGHGCEPTVFYPLPPAERQRARVECIGIEDPETFIVLWVNRNQFRKDPARAMAAFHLFHEQVPNSVLYMHSKQTDMGGNLPMMALYQGLDLGSEIRFTPSWFHEGVGVSRETLNQIYNAGDVFISTSMGEGWGLTTTDAMAAGVPVIAPRNTTFIEQLGEDRGYLVQSGGPDLWTVWYGMSDNPRPQTSVTGLVSALKTVYLDPIGAAQRATRARHWTFEHSWPRTEELWLKLFSNRGITASARPITDTCCTTGMTSASEQVSTR